MGVRRREEGVGRCRLGWVWGLGWDGMEGWAFW